MTHEVLFLCRDVVSPATEALEGQAAEEMLKEFDKINHESFDENIIVSERKTKKKGKSNEEEDSSPSSVVSDVDQLLYSDSQDLSEGGTDQQGALQDSLGNLRLELSTEMDQQGKRD